VHGYLLNDFNPRSAQIRWSRPATPDTAMFYAPSRTIAGIRGWVESLGWTRDSEECAGGSF
jgi:hypothetical protein